MPSEKAGLNKQDLSSHSFVPIWLAQAVQQPFPDTWDSSSLTQPSSWKYQKTRETGVCHSSWLRAA